MLGKQSKQMGLGDLEAMGRLPESHFLKKIDSQIDWRPFGKIREPLYHPTQTRPSHPPLVMFTTNEQSKDYFCHSERSEESLFLRLFGIKTLSQA